MNAIEIIGAILMIVVGVLVVIMTAIQNPKGDAVSSLAGGGMDSFMNRSGDRSLDATLNRFIKIGCIAVFVITAVVYALGAWL
ncbi:MAG: preprotein translocase subunit SecG [Oscillospiraceae bacterium]|nr:preprotein translocase subunit SecG [Oscillospiraceae bacterium]